MLLVQDERRTGITAPQQRPLMRGSERSRGSALFPLSWMSVAHSSSTGVLAIFYVFLIVLVLAPFLHQDSDPQRDQYLPLWLPAIGCGPQQVPFETGGARGRLQFYRWETDSVRLSGQPKRGSTTLTVVRGCWLRAFPALCSQGLLKPVRFITQLRKEYQRLRKTRASEIDHLS